MEKSLFSKIVLGDTDPNEIGDIRSFQEMHPYFEIGYYLLAGQMKDKDSYASSDSLKKASVYAGDRRKLYYFLNQKTQFPETEPHIEEEREIVEQENKLEFTDETDKTSHLDQKRVSEENEASQLQSDIQETGNKDLPKEEADQGHELDKLIQIGSSEVLIAKQLTDEKPEVEEESFESEPHSFIDWLHHMKPVEGSSVNTNVESDVEEVRPKEPNKEVKAEDISELANKSVEASDEIISETLATIYIKQKKHKKAIETLEKLSLKYPEKSAYFADRIEEIKKIQ